LESILSIQPRVSNSSGKNREDTIYEIAENIESKTPEVFDIEQIMKKYPTDYNESMNTVLVQELVRYNRLLAVMKSTLANLKKALKGLVVMSDDLEKLSNSIFDNQVGKVWADVSFLSLKPLGSWIEDLSLRIKFLKDWIEGGTPMIFWMSGFFFPQAFVTGSLQNYARKKTIAIDKINYKFSMLDRLSSPSDITEKPEFGCYVYGLFIEGCRWHYENHCLDDSRPKELFSPLPIMHLLPTEDRVDNSQAYQCPLYKVVSRSGTLSTTGHSTNFVMFIELPTERRPDDWILSGVAAFLSLRY
jgi:dynein heavy chain, axonemal